MQEETQGEFGGLGILLGIRDEVLTVISPMESTPAFRAGIRSQDQLIKINETSTEGMSVEAAVKILRGKPGTSVTLSIRRDKEILPPMQITRDFIKVPSVKAGKLSTGIGYARIASFSASTGADLDLEIDKMEADSSLMGLILDLRGNPGGLLSAAVEVAQDLLGNGKTIVSIRGRDTEDTVFNSQSQKIREWPLVVLIDGGSASASEIVAGAIKDNKRGVLIGTKSYGKGSVQTVMPLPNGAALALTTAYYYTPAGIKIHQIGITPDIEVPFPKLSESDLQEYRDFMEKSINQTHEKTREKQAAYLNSQNASQKATAATTSSETMSSTTNVSDFLPVSHHDTQLSRALDVIKALQILREKKR
jgi:carboxyl-terminal processing protease